MATPEKILTNSDLEKLVDTNDEWITSRTGMKERWICGPDETSATLGTQAAKNALAMANLDPAKLDLIICATATPDHPWPATACLIQQSIGAVNAAAFDLSAACSGFCYGLATASGFIQTQACKNVLVIGVDTLTKQVDWTDRNTCILFGDGAGAAVLTATEGPYGVLASTLGADGHKGETGWCGKRFL